MPTTSGARTPRFSPQRSIEPVLIREATPADIPALLRIEQRVAAAAHWTPLQYQALFARDLLPCITLVAEAPPPAGAIHGFVIGRSQGPDWEIENLAVDARERRQGIGGRLVRELLARLRGAGVTEVLLEVRESNTAALRLYESVGFRHEGRRPQYYHDPDEDALLLRLRLQPCDKTP
jgi:ribosomal-protein-alanine N-acetyltransferase